MDIGVSIHGGVQSSHQRIKCICNGMQKIINPEITSNKTIHKSQELC